MNREMQVKLVENLKSLNAKERDLLMRNAYLGIDHVGKQKFLSESFDTRLTALIAEKLNLREKPECVFAGMDYHLDWLFAALSMTTRNLGPGDSDAGGKMELHDATQGPASKYTDFRTVTGTQEDIDLLVVYQVNTELVLLFIEAKGSAAFDRVQLARKLIRLDRILVDCGVAKNGAQPLQYLLVLASPERPKFRDSKNRNVMLDCLQFASQLPEKESKFEALREALKDHKSGIGSGLHYLPISGYPKTLYAVKRVDADAAADKKHTNWRLETR